MSNEKNVSQALTYAIEAIELYLALLKKHEPTNAVDFADAQFLKEFIQAQINLLTKEE
ncbi:hypothetical protein UFOVP377_44 [uncultured Caudovirales phage]|uniref:Uncharacterized protein n=1 Tax=uncultured Caudovirales phage TaxID=2100421 RepID=A0A6J7X6T8_9CAUD|nr:hypothetical protein UFOVP377_44 [uncultured Caudovirales phage]